jgi:pSer/pThr/pTyr-binding forkhead associated (FHA) protein
MSRAKLLPRGSEAGAPIRLPAEGRLTVGREESNDLPLRDPSVSREHAILEIDGDRWTVRDLDSANGTFVNGRPVRERRLKGGELVRFGAHPEFRFLREAGTARWKEPFLAFLRHALVARDPEFEPARFPIRRATSIVGRSANANLTLPYSQISDIHARLENRAGRPWVSDHRSRNGTYVNGEPVREQLLRPGDEVAFADRPFDVVVTAHPTSRGIVGVTGVAAVASLVIVGLSLLSTERGTGDELWTRRMYEEQATRSLSDAIAAYDRSPPALDVARAQFDIALRSLISADALPPDPRDAEEIDAAFRTAARSLTARLGGRNPYRIYTSLATAGALEEEPAPGSIVESQLARILAEFGIDPANGEIPPDLLAEVKRFVDYWTGDMRGYTVRSMRRAEPHLDMIRAELKKNRLPEVFCYIPFVESGYRTEVSSRAGAGGMWQFMPKTARAYGLRVDEGVDERSDPVRSTQAACRYLDGLLFSFGANAFMCAVAAYNKGEYGMLTCLKRHAAGEPGSWKSKWKFWDMVESGSGCLKPETIEYVPRVLAAAIVMRRPGAFGLTDARERGR